MEPTTMSERDAQDNFQRLMTAVRETRKPVVIERDGEPVAVVISVEEFERSQELAEQTQQDAWSVVDRLHALNEDVDPDEVYRVVTEAVEEVRRDMLLERQGRERHV